MIGGSNTRGIGSRHPLLVVSCIVSKSWKLLKTGKWPLKYFLQRLFGTTHKDNLVLVPLDPRRMAACWGDPNELDQWRACSIGVSSLAEAESELHVLAHARNNFSLENIFRPLHLLCHRIASWTPFDNCKDRKAATWDFCCVCWCFKGM